MLVRVQEQSSKAIPLKTCVGQCLVSETIYHHFGRRNGECITQLWFAADRGP